MKHEEPRAGDMAVVIHCITHPAMVGQLIHVLSDPFLIEPGFYRNFGKWHGGQENLRVTTATRVSRYQHGPTEWGIRTDCLLRIPPDSEAKRLFADEGVSA